MKKILTAITAVGVLAGVALAQEVVTSVNIVGYKKHTLVAGKIYLISTQFESIDGSPITPNTAIGNQLPLGSKLFRWDAKKLPAPGYNISTSVSNFLFAGWNGNVVLNGTSGFWLQPAGAPGTTYEVAFLGEVPMRAAYTNVIAEAITMTAYPFTADVPFKNTALYARSKVGDKMYIWNPDLGASGGYQIYTSVSNFLFAGWNNGGENLIISQGTGIWYDRAGAGDLTIVDARPYNP